MVVCIGKVALIKDLEGDWIVNQVDIWGKSIPGRKANNGKGTKEGACLMCWRTAWLQVSLEQMSGKGCERGKKRPNYARHGGPLSGYWLLLGVKRRSTAGFSAEE